MATKRKVFVSTRETQGQRKNDFSWVPEGQLVTLPTGGFCGGEKADDPCGCGRALVGVVNHKGTTTAKVIETDLTKEGLAKLLTKSAQDVGWGFYKIKNGRTIATWLMAAAEQFKVGTIVEFRDKRISKRKARPTSTVVTT